MQEVCRRRVKGRFGEPQSTRGQTCGESFECRKKINKIYTSNIVTSLGLDDIFVYHLGVQKVSVFSCEGGRRLV